MRSQKEWLVEKAVMFLCLLIAAAAVLWLLVGSVAYWVKHGWLPADTSGWVQAVGGLMAVAVAIAVPAWQKRHELQQRLIAERRERIESVYALLALIQDQGALAEWAVGRLCAIDGYHFVLEARSPKHNEVLVRFRQHEGSAEAVEPFSFGKEFVQQVLAYRERASFMAGIARAVGSKSPDREAFVRDLRRLQKFPDRLRELEADLIKMSDDLEAGRY